MNIMKFLNHFDENELIFHLNVIYEIMELGLPPFQGFFFSIRTIIFESFLDEEQDGIIYFD